MRLRTPDNMNSPTEALRDQEKRRRESWIHPRASESTGNFADVLRHQNQGEIEQQMHGQVLKQSGKELSEAHPDTQKSRIALSAAWDW